jgi:hypothetical protein
MNPETQLEKINRIIGKGNASKADQNLAHFNVDEKCTAIYNWKNNTKTEFDMSFVESVHDYFERMGRCSNNQIIALDKIINKFKIDISKWSY